MQRAIGGDDRNGPIQRTSDQVADRMVDQPLGLVAELAARSAAGLRTAVMS